MSEEAVAVLLSLAASVFTIVGGVGGGMFMAYLACLGVLLIIMIYFFNGFYPAADGPTHPWGFTYDASTPVVDKICEILQCAHTNSDFDNFEDSVLTFRAQTAFLAGLCGFIPGLAYLTLNQATWTSASMAKPRHAVGGFIIAGIAFFGIPFMMTFVFGVGEWVNTVVSGEKSVSGKVCQEGLLPALVSQLTLGRAGDFMICILFILVVIVSVSAQINSLTAIFVYDIYQTYINPFSSSCLVDIADSADYKTQYLCYNKQMVWIRFGISTLVSVLTFPLALLFMAIDVNFVYKILVIGIVLCPPCVPVWLTLLWYRTTRWGFCLGTILGHVAGFVTWLSYAASYPDGLNDFLENTGKQKVWLAATGVGLGTGAVVCVLHSLVFGSDDPVKEEEQWQNCMSLDNPAKPWVLQYASKSSLTDDLVDVPSYRQLRRRYKWTLLSGYVVGPLLAVLIMVVWPALMLLTGVMSCSDFARWTALVIVIAVISALLLVIVTPIAEFIKLSLSPAKNRQDEWMSRPDVIDRRPQQQYFNDRLLITRQNAPVVYSRPPPRRQPSNWIQPNRAPQYRMSPPGYGYGAYPPAYVGHMYSPAMNRFPYYNRYY